MAYFAVLYEVVDDYVARRAPFREEHLKRMREAEDHGEVIMGGAFTDPPDKALLIFRADDRSKVEAFVRQDPYIVNGLVKKFEIRAWNVVIGNT